MTKITGRTVRDLLMIEEVASAKVNLYLHVGGTRQDGLHELKSLFVFTEDGDRIQAELDERVSLKIVGQFADVLTAEPVESNLVFKAALALQSAFNVKSGARLTLDKRLPVAAGIGGGSADAAAALLALVKLWDIQADVAQLEEIAFNLGADVPACLHRRPIVVGGAGEKITPFEGLPLLWVCLVNPGVATPTGPIFASFDAKNPSPNEPIVPETTPQAGIQHIVSLLEKSHNDLEPIAVEMRPVIGNVLDLLATVPGGMVARMSGSGATCFALFQSEQDARGCAELARAEGWWAMASRLLTG